MAGTGPESALGANEHFVDAGLLLQDVLDQARRLEHLIQCVRDTVPARATEGLGLRVRQLHPRLHLSWRKACMSSHLTGYLTHRVPGPMAARATGRKGGGICFNMELADKAQLGADSQMRQGYVLYP